MTEIDVTLKFERAFKGELQAKNTTVPIGSEAGTLAPYDMMLGALGSCYYANFRGIAEKMRLEYERVEIYNINNGERFATYAIRAEEGSGVISVNGAAAHKAAPGDLVIICAYGTLDEADVANFKPTLVYVDRDNRMTHTNDSIPAQGA